MRASRIGERPSPRKRTLTLDAGFFVGLALVGLLAWWVHGDEPPGLPGEPDLRPYRGTPLLLVYGAPGCEACVANWPSLRDDLPRGLRVMHLVARQSDADRRPATAETARRWAAVLGVRGTEVLPAALPTRRLPAFVLRDDRGRWRLEHSGPYDAPARERLRRALALEGLGREAPPGVPAAPP